jgi:hypothetical protein
MMYRRTIRNISAALALALVAGLPLQASSQEPGSVREHSQWSQKKGAVSEVESDFRLIERIGTRYAYETFLRTHKTGPYADRVREHLEKLRAIEGQLEVIHNGRLINERRARP